MFSSSVHPRPLEMEHFDNSALKYTNFLPDMLHVVAVNPGLVEVFPLFSPCDKKGPVVLHSHAEVDLFYHIITVKCSRSLK